MTPKSCMRTIACLVDDSWVPCSMGQLEVGDIIRVYEPDSTPVEHEGSRQFVVKSAAFIDFVVDENSV